VIPTQRDQRHALFVGNFTNVVARCPWGNNVSGRRSRDKGARTERAIARLLQGQGLAATKPAANISLSLLGIDRAVEFKCRAAGLTQFYTWVNCCVLIVKADRQEPLVVFRMSLAATIVKRPIA
jgi:hypothetical protein